MVSYNDNEFVKFMLDKAKKREPQEKSQLSGDADLKTVEDITKNLTEKAAAKKR